MLCHILRTRESFLWAVEASNPACDTSSCAFSEVASVGRTGRTRRTRTVFRLNEEMATVTLNRLGAQIKVGRC